MKHFLSAAAFIAAVASPAAQAQLHLTGAGIADGFTLSLFVDQIPSSGPYGPFGMATNSAGQVVMQVYPNGRNYVYNDVDGQHFSAALSSTPFQSLNYAAAITNSGGTLFATNQDAGSVIYRLNPDGSVNSPLTGTGIGGHGLWTNPSTGHLVTANGSQIRDVNQITGASTVIVSGVDVDGLSVSEDGATIYGATNGHVYGWNYGGALVFDSGFLGSPDGTGVIQGVNLFSGDIISNNNDGTVYLIDPTLHTSTLIATGGTRGDYVGLDDNDGSLLLNQTNSVYRLGCGPSCFFTAPVPEPETYALMLIGLGGLALMRRRRLRRE